MSNHNKKIAFALAEVFSPHPTSPQRTAFTLAEVLITLGIIGVVAAMTLPAVIAKKEKEETTVRLKKIYSVLNNAVTAAVNVHGDVQNWDLDTVTDNGRMKILKTYFVPYLNIGSECYRNNMKSCWNSPDNITGVFYNISGEPAYQVASAVMLNDGSAFGFVPELGNPYIIVDINGGRKPNRLGKDQFTMTLNKNNNRIDMYGFSYTRDDLINPNLFVPNGGACVLGHKRYDGLYCGALIQKDGWKIKEDYPW